MEIGDLERARGPRPLPRLQLDVAPLDRGGVIVEADELADLGNAWAIRMVEAPCPQPTSATSRACRLSLSTTPSSAGSPLRDEVAAIARSEEPLGAAKQAGARARANRTRHRCESSPPCEAPLRKPRQSPRTPRRRRTGWSHRPAPRPAPAAAYTFRSSHRRRHIRPRPDSPATREYIARPSRPPRQLGRRERPSPGHRLIQPQLVADQRQHRADRRPNVPHRLPHKSFELRLVNPCRTHENPFAIMTTARFGPPVGQANHSRHQHVEPSLRYQVHNEGPSGTGSALPRFRSPATSCKHPLHRPLLRRAGCPAPTALVSPPYLRGCDPKYPFRLLSDRSRHRIEHHVYLGVF